MSASSKEKHDQGHIPNAMHNSIKTLEDKISDLDKDFQFITVCGKGEGRLANGAKLLKEHGLNAIWLYGNTSNW